MFDVGSGTPPTAWTVLITYLRPQARRALALGVLLLAAIAFDLANPQILRAFIDSATQGAETQQLVTIALAFLAVAVTSQAVTVGETFKRRKSLRQVPRFVDVVLEAFARAQANA